MKPKIDFDPMFGASRRRRYWPIRAIGLALIVSVASGLVLRAGPIPPREAGSPSGKVARVAQGRIDVRGFVPGPQVPNPSAPNRWGPNLPAGTVQRRDPFVITAPAEIDPGMVRQARRDLDAEMVFNPDTGRRGWAPGGPAPAGNRKWPWPVPGPAPDGVRPHRSSPQPFVIPQAH
jgi:hypothetical protein